MIRVATDENGEKYYYQMRLKVRRNLKGKKFTTKEPVRVNIPKRGALKQGRIPEGVYGRFIKVIPDKF